MNLQSWSSNVADADGGAAVAGFFRQIRRGGLLSTRRFMLSVLRVRRVAVSFVWMLALALVSQAPAQTNYYATNGTEYSVVGSLLGDQVFPDVAISPTNGMVVWQDNATDGDGWGVSARRLDGTLSGTLSTFRVNVIGVGDQENPRVTLLKNGGAAFVWQGGKPGVQHIYSRFLTAGNTFLTTNDVRVNTFTNNFQNNPALAVLTNGNVVVVWASFDQVSTNSLLDVYGQILSTNGTAVGTNFLVNQFTSYNQRTPAVAALPNGGFVVSWVSEQERLLAPDLGSNTVYSSASALAQPSVDIYARLFNASGTPSAGEFLVDTDASPCANPAMAVASDGSFLVAWTEKDLTNHTNSWDIHARPFSSAGVGGNSLIVNTYLIGDQYIPHVKSIGLDYFVTWTSLGQDGSREGVFGQFVHSDGTKVGGEFQVNTTWLGSQMQPAMASDGASQFLVVWTSFTGSPYGFDLFGQRYINVSSILLAMSAPYVWAPFVVRNNVYQPQLVVSWSPVLGLSVSNYEVYVNGSGTPTGVVNSNNWTMTAANGLTASSTNSFALDYVTADGRRSPLSPSASGATWSGYSWYGIPFEWMAQFYGDSIGNWPGSVTKPLVAGGPSLYQIFLSGGNPTNSATWLSEQVTTTAEGPFLSWNTQAGATYQVQSTPDFDTWTNVGSPRFAAGISDSIFIGGAANKYFRVVLLRQ
jgi:hypothetical protein